MRMSPTRLILGLIVPVVGAAAQSAPLALPEVQVSSPRVALQDPAGTFAMPVTVLRYEPRVDVQARNLAEAQADIAIRGGTFENTGFKAGALQLYDPQTGHYFAEIPVAATMLGSPRVHTGAEHAASGWNATAGSIAYAWLPVRSGGYASAGFGGNDFQRGEFYAAHAGLLEMAGRRVSADVSVAHSSSDGTIPLGDHEFTRYNARVQLADATSQTDFVAGYQSKFFGWPNLYTPFNSPESENLKTTLLAFNHHVRQADGGHFQAGAYYRRNRDDYDFNRYTEAGKDPFFAHTTWVYGASIEGRAPFGDQLAVTYRAGYIADELTSTALTFGRFRTRSHVSAGVFPEWRWRDAAGPVWTVTAGAAFDDTNRDGSSVSPTLSVTGDYTSGALRRVRAGYAKSTQVPTYTALNSATAAGLFRGNPNLGRSASHELEVGASGTWAGWDAEAAVFFRRDDRLVDWTFARGVTARTANAVDMDTTGVEFFGRRTFGPVDLVLGYAWLHKNSDYGTAAVDASFYALNFPKHRLTAAIIARLGYGFELRMDNDLRIQEDNLLRVRGGDEAILSSLALFWRPPLARSLRLSLQVDNLWDSDFQAVPAVPASRRQVAVGVTCFW